MIISLIKKALFPIRILANVPAPSSALRLVKPTANMSIPAGAPSDSSVYPPQFHLLCMQASAATAFATALARYPTLASKLDYTIHESALSTLPDSVNFDLVVSPANSYGILDGGFDDAISRAFSPKDDYHALTRHVQTELYREYKGYLPPGTCHLVRMIEEWKGSEGSESRLRYGDGKGWGCKWLAMVPTMRVPMPLHADKEIVYRCVWSILVAIDRHNRVVDQADRVVSVLMTPLGTGAGGLSDTRWAEQCVLAMKHFVDACEGPEVWSRVNWGTAMSIGKEIVAVSGTKTWFG